MSWDDFHRATTPVSRKGVVWACVIAFALVVVLPLALWLAGVFASPVVGQANAYRDKHRAGNWTQAQAGFERSWASILKLDKQTGAAADDMDTYNKVHPVDPDAGPGNAVEEQRANLATDYKGARQQCQNAVADYNAAARTYTLRDFRAVDLPAQIDDTDPTTDCK